MTWKQITDFDKSKDIWISIQNNSLIPFSKVTVQFTTKGAPEEGKGFVLTGPNQWSQRVPAGTNIFYKEEDGGIITWWHREIEKLVNYDIPTQEDTIENFKTKSIACPEGSFISLQCLTDTPIFYNLLGKGHFVLTKYQGWSYTFAKDEVINLSSDGTGSFTYILGQSPNVTMLSEATQNLLDEINAKIEGLMENAATKEELDVVKRRTYFGQWCPYLSITGQAGTSINSPIFKTDENYHSEMIQDKQILDMSAEIVYTRRDDTEGRDIEERASIFATLVTQPSGEGHQFTNFYCDTPWFSQHISGLELYRDETNGKIRLVINLKSQIKSYTVAMSLRTDTSKFVADTGSGFLNEKICTYSIDKDNTGIHFTDEQFYLGIMSSWQFALKTDKYKVESLSKKDSSDGATNTQLFSSTIDDFKVKYDEKLDGSSGIFTLDIPLSAGINRVVGLNIKTKDVSKSNNVYLDLIVLGDGKQTKVNSGTVNRITIPLWKHITYGYMFVSERLSKVTETNAKDYYIEVIYE